MNSYELLRLKFRTDVPPFRKFQIPNVVKACKNGLKVGFYSNYIG